MKFQCSETSTFLIEKHFLKIQKSTETDNELQKNFGTNCLAPIIH